MSDEWKRRARSFDACAAEYDAFRPSYPAGAIDEILRFGRLQPGARALEIGPGTGKATRLLEDRGLRVTGIEPGAELIEVARARCPTSRFHRSTFEEWALGDDAGRFDLVVAAQSFHWVDQTTGYAKTAEALRPRGVLALFWNRPRITAGSLFARLEGIYSEYVAASETVTEAQLPEIELSIDRCIEGTGLFAKPARAEFPWTDRLSSNAYVSLLTTTSLCATMEADRRDEVVARLRAMIDAHGGEVDVGYTTVLHLAKRL